MIRAVIFDLDGTLFDSTEAIVDSFFHLFDQLGKPRPARDRIVSGIGHPLVEAIPRLTDHDPEECIAIYRDYYPRVACAKTHLLPGAREILEAFHQAGLKQGFVTSRKRDSAELLLDYFGILQYFQCRIGPDEVSRPKPHPEGILLAAKQLGASPGELCVVGDMHFDILAARDAGARCVCVTTGYATRSELEALAPEAVFTRLDQVRYHLLDANASG